MSSSSSTTSDALARAAALLALLMAAGFVSVFTDAATADTVQQDLRGRIGTEPNEARAKNVVLVIGDGMSIATISAARVLAGQGAGGPGEEHELPVDRFPYVGLLRTYNVDRQTPDSAAAMTAIVSGHKTNAGLLGLSPSVRREDCPWPPSAELPSLLAMAERSGRATGIVTTARLTHATPAAAYAHASDRSWEDDSDLPRGEAAACRDIAAQFVEWPHGDGMEVALGGGRRHFMPRDQADPEYPSERGKRRDGRDLIAEWDGREGHCSATSTDSLLALDRSACQHVLGLFEPGHMRYASDRANDPLGEPSLVSMVDFALSRLTANPVGYFLIVEAGRIDHRHHAAHARGALNETLDMMKAIELLLERTQASDTLLMVTADHGHAMWFGGYHTPRGNPVLGDVMDFEDPARPARDEKGETYPVLTYVNGPGTGTPLEKASHSAEDVAVFARGPWAHLLTGSAEQTAIFYAIAHATALEPLR